MGKEIELKLQIDSAAQMEQVRRDSELSRFASGSEHLIRMETTYYDTPDGTISAKKWTLRRRRENGICVTCLKTPGENPDAPAAARGEWETTEHDIEKAIAQLVADGAPAELTALTAEGLIETCCACFLRRALLLQLPDGSTCELACDAGELSGGQNRREFFEIELELKRGEPAQMLALGQHLQAAYGLRVERQSKFARAAALRI